MVASRKRSGRGRAGSGIWLIWLRPWIWVSTVVWSWLHRMFLVQLIVRVVREVSEDDATHMAAGISYYALFSVFPLVLGMTALFSVFVDTETVILRLTQFANEYLPGTEDLIRQNVETALALRGALGLFAVLGLFWSASAVFGALNRSINRAWDIQVDRPLYVGKPRQMLMAVGVALLFIMSLGAATLAREAERISESGIPLIESIPTLSSEVFLRAASVLLTLAIFLLIYRYMPNTKTYWRYIWPGAIVGTLLFETAKNVFIIYTSRFANFENVYGSLAPVIALLLWAYVASFILILGAEISSEYERLKRGAAQGRLLEPHD